MIDRIKYWFGKDFGRKIGDLVRDYKGFDGGEILGRVMEVGDWVGWKEGVYGDFGRRKGVWRRQDGGEWRKGRERFGD